MAHISTNDASSISLAARLHPEIDKAGGNLFFLAGWDALRKE